MLALDSTTLEARAGEVASALAALANEKRLLILCRLAEGETGVSALATSVGLSQSALSQHLAKMRAEGLLGTRRQGQAVFYRITDERVLALMQSLQSIYCVPE